MVRRDAFSWLQWTREESTQGLPWTKWIDKEVDDSVETRSASVENAGTDQGSRSGVPYPPGVHVSRSSS